MLTCTLWLTTIRPSSIISSNVRTDFLATSLEKHHFRSVFSFTSIFAKVRTRTNALCSCEFHQSFSSTSSRLRYIDAVKMTELHEQLSQCYNNHALVPNMQKVSNISGISAKTNCVNTINLLTQYRSGVCSLGRLEVMAVIKIHTQIFIQDNSQ